jgi:hypothetical protein
LPRGIGHIRGGSRILQHHHIGADIRHHQGQPPHHPCQAHVSGSLENSLIRMPPEAKALSANLNNAFFVFWL